MGRGSWWNRVCRRRQRPRGQFPDCNRRTVRHYLVTALRKPQARSCPMAEHDGQLNQSSDSAPFLPAGFDPRQIRPRLPDRGRRVTAPAQAGAAGLLASGLGMAPCLRACALRQSDRENAPPERFQAVLWGRWSGRGAGSGCLPEGASRRARGDVLGIRLVNLTAPAQAGAAGLLPSGLRMAPCLRACALRQSDRENASPERFQAVLRGRFSGVCRWVFAGDRSSGTSCGLANRPTPAGLAA